MLFASSQYVLGDKNCVSNQRIEGSTHSVLGKVLFAAFYHFDVNGITSNTAQSYFVWSIHEMNCAVFSVTCLNLSESLNPVQA